MSAPLGHPAPANRDVVPSVAQERGFAAFVHPRMTGCSTIADAESGSMTRESRELRREESPGLYCVELRTENWQTVLNWYREVLGLRVSVRVVEDGYSLLDAGETRLALIKRTSAGESSKRISLAFEVHDVRLMCAAGSGRFARFVSATRCRGAARGKHDRPGRQPHPLVFLAAWPTGRGTLPNLGGQGRDNSRLGTKWFGTMAPSGPLSIGFGPHVLVLSPVRVVVWSKC